MSQAQAQKFVNSFMNKLAGDGVKLPPSLQGVFVKILANQVTVDETTNLVTFASAFETLSKVFTFIATPAVNRPSAGPLSYLPAKFKEAKQAAAIEVDLKVEGLPSTPEEPEEPEEPVNLGENFTLIESSDNLVGTDKDDIFKAVVGNTSATLNVNDKIDGSGGDDTLQVEMKSNFTGFDAGAGIKNIENVILTNTSTAAAIFNAKGVTGVNQYTLNAKKAALALNGLNKAGITVQVNEQAAGELAIGFDAAAVAGTNDALTLGLNKVGTAAGKGVEAKVVKVKVEGIENLAVNLEGNNLIDLSGVTDAKILTIKSIATTGTGTLNVTNIGAAVTTFDASAVTGAVHLDLSQIKAIATNAKLTTLTTGNGDDVVTLDLTKLAANVKLNGGEGNNTLKLLGADKATLGVEQSEQSVKGFQTLELSGKGIKTLGTAVTDVKTLVLNGQIGDVAATFAKASELTLNAVGANTAKITLNTVDNLASANVLTYKTTAKTSTDVTKLEVSKGEITSSFASKLVIDLGDFTQQSGKINANSATDVVLNVAKNAEFSAAVNALVAKSLTINAAGKLNTKDIIVDYATAVDITASQGGAVRVVAEKAKIVKIIAGDNLALTGSSFKEAETVAITVNKGLVTGSNVNLAAVKNLKLAGVGSVELGTIGSGGKEGQKAINLDIVDMKAFTAGTIQGDSIDIKAVSSGSTKIVNIFATAGEKITINLTDSSAGANTPNGEFIITGLIGFSPKNPTPKAMFAKSEGPMLLTEGKDIFKVVLEGDAKFSLGSTVVADIIDVDASAFTGTDTASSFGKMSADTITLKGKGLEANQITIAQGKDISVTGGSEADSLILEQAIGKTDAIKITFNGGAEDSLEFTNANPVDLTNTNSALNLTGVARVKANDLKVKASDITAKPLEIDGKLVIANVVAGTDLSQISAADKGGVEIETQVGADGVLILGGIKDIEDLTIAVKDPVPAGTSVKFDTTDLGLTNLTFKLGANDTSEDIVKLSADSVFNVPGDLTIQSGQLDVSAVPVGNFSVGTNGDGTVLTLNKSGLKLSVEQLLALSKQAGLVIDADPDPTANGVQVEITKDTTPEQIAALEEALKENGDLAGIFAPGSKPTITIAGDVVGDNKTAADAAKAAGDNFVGRAVDPQIKYAEDVEIAKTAANKALTDLNAFKDAFVALDAIDTLDKAAAAKAAATELNNAIGKAEQAAIAYVDAASNTHDPADDIAAEDKAGLITAATAAATTSLNTKQAAAFNAAFAAAESAIADIADANKDPDTKMTVAVARDFVVSKTEGTQAAEAAEAAKALASAIAESILEPTKKSNAVGAVENLHIPDIQELTSIANIEDTAANLAAATDLFKYADRISVIEGTSATVAEAIAIVQAAADNFVGVSGVNVVDTIATIQVVTEPKDLAVLTLVDSVKFSGSEIELAPKQFTAFGSKLDDNKAKINGDVAAPADVAAVVENPSKLINSGITAISLTAAQFATAGLPAKLTAKAATIMNKDLISGSDANALVENADKIKAGTIQKIAITAEQFVAANVIAALGANAAKILAPVGAAETATVVANIDKIANLGIPKITLTADQFTRAGVIDALSTNAATITGVIDTAQAAAIVTNVAKIAVGGIQGKITLKADDILKAKDGLLTKLGSDATLTVTSEKPLTIAEVRKIFDKVNKVTLDNIKVEDKAELLSDPTNNDLLAKFNSVIVSDPATVAQVKAILAAATLATPSGVTIDKITDTATSLTNLAGDSNSASAPYLVALKKATEVTATIGDHSSNFTQDLSGIVSDAAIKIAKITAAGEFKGNFADFALVIDDKVTLTADAAKLTDLTATGKGNLVVTAAAAIKDTDLAEIAIAGKVTVAVTDGKNVDNAINLGKVVGKAEITGGDKVDTITASKGGSEITGGKGNDKITLGAGIDTVKFSGTRDLNGVDEITGFTAGARLGDKLDFNSFLFGDVAIVGAKLIGTNGVAGGALSNFSAAAKTGKITDIAGKVVVLEGALGADDADTTALKKSIIFAGQGGDSAKFSLADGQKTIVLSAKGAEFKDAKIMNVYYVTGQQGDDKMELVGTVTLDPASAGFVTGNFA